MGPYERLGDGSVDRQVKQRVQAHELDHRVGVPICTTQREGKEGEKLGGRLLWGVGRHSSSLDMQFLASSVMVMAEIWLLWSKCGYGV
jgi:hypothetical protein